MAVAFAQEPSSGLSIIARTSTTEESLLPVLAAAVHEIDPGISTFAARTMNDIARTYMPEMPVYFRLESNYVQPWLQGFRPGTFQSYWKYLDVDTARRK